MFFDNRGKGHDGTITSDRTQLLASDEDTVGAEAWIGWGILDGKAFARIETASSGS